MIPLEALGVARAWFQSTLPGSIPNDKTLDSLAEVLSLYGKSCEKIEREECAKVCDDYAKNQKSCALLYPQEAEDMRDRASGAIDCAKFIRNRQK